MRLWEGVVLDGITDFKVREPLEKMNRQLKELAGALSPGAQAGGTALVPTIRELEGVNMLARAVPLGATEGIPGTAHWLRCNASGHLKTSVENEVAILELPAVVASAQGQGFGAYLGWPTAFSYIAGITTVRKASTMGSAADRLALVTGAPIRDFTYGYESGANTEEDVGAHTVDLPRGINRQEVVFDGGSPHIPSQSKYYSGGVPGFPTVTFGTGGVGAAYRQASRIRKLALSFTASLNGTLPNDTMTIRVYGLNQAATTPGGALVREWIFDSASWVLNGGTKYLEFDMLYPYFTVVIVASNVLPPDASNNFQITNFFVVGKN